MLHGGNASGGSLSEHLINLALGDSRVSSWVDPGDESISSHHKGLDLVILGIRVVDWHARPVLLDQRVGDWDCVSPVSVSLLVAASLTLNEDDLSSRVLWLRQESRQSSWGGSWGGRWVGLGHLNNLDDGIRNLVLEVQLLGNANARAVELSNKVGVLTVNLVSKDEIGGPDQWNWHALHSQARHDLWKILVHEVIHELLEHRIIRLVRDVLGAGLEGSGDAALSWLLVHNLGWLVVDHVHAKLSLNNTWQEALVNQLTVLTNNVLLAEGHEVIKSLLLLVVVDSLLQVQDGGSGDLSLLSLLDLAHPDALTLRAAVLLHHPDSGGNALCPRRLVLCVPEGTDALGGARHHNENQLDAELPPQHAVQKILVHNHGIWPPCR